jgi:CheY-like chemotaxis protein
MKDHFKGLSVIVADDDTNLLETLQFQFEYFGFKVTVANNGKEGFQRFSEKESDLIVSDMCMPVSSGLDFLDHVVRKGSKKTPFIILTGFSGESLDEVLDHGADQMIFKPIPPSQLLAILSVVLEPLAQRWQKPLDEKINLKIDGDFSKSKVEDFKLGRLGFFISKKSAPCFEELKNGSLVNFSLINPAPECPRIEGVGKVVWKRDIAATSLLEGCGIEFLYLADNCREHFVTYLQQTPPKCTIPRGGQDKV